MGEQRSTSFGGTFGMTGGKPTALVNSTAGKLTSSMTEVADDEVQCDFIFSRLLNKNCSSPKDY